MASVKLTNVKKIYGKNTVAVHDFNLDIADKEFIVFVGPSGCGKSTTLRMIAGLEDISDGTVEIDGKVVNDLLPKDRGIAMVFQNYALYPHLTVFENMAFSLRLKKVDNDEIYKRVTEAAEVLGITEYLTRRPRELSGGQRQRVAIGRAMVRDSKVFLMDEPLSNLDAKLRNQMRAEIILLRKKINTTFIYVTHDQTEAMTLGDRIVIMKDGYIMQVGSPSQVFEMPENLFVAEFIGAPKMNTMRTRLELEKGEYYVSPFGVKMPVSGEKAEALKEKGVEAQDIVLGVRPEHITLSNSKNPCAVPCQIRVKEMMGSELHLHVTTSTDETLVIRVPTVDIAPHQLAALLPGVRIYVTFRSKVMHFFNAESEQNLLTEQKSIEGKSEESAEEAISSDKEPKTENKKEEV
ncbi:MAG: sn-glycerol-3-phosphate ABC transporter ATP-binding protein UgpC [Clostridiales bacterium]|nr:sn-glycerol-3-phosphate ABC transporter ATP-binding protein UgpC [Clostridiales bacterium]